jgi:hypothetical protein
VCVCVCVCLCVWNPRNFDRASELCVRDAKPTTQNRHMCPYSKPRTKHQRVHFVIMLYMSLLSCGGALKEPQHTGICAPTASPAQNTKGCNFFQSISGAGCGRLLQVVNSRKTALQASSKQQNCNSKTATEKLHYLLRRLLAYPRSLSQAHIHTHTDIHTHTHKLSLSLTHTRNCTNANLTSYAHAHTNIHTHTHIRHINFGVVHTPLVEKVVR